MGRSRTRNFSVINIKQYILATALPAYRTRPYFFIWILLNFFLALFLITVLGKGIVTSEPDGFTAQIRYITQTPISAWEPLEYVHAIRYMIAFPFIQLEAISPWLSSLFMLTLLIPFLRLKPNHSKTSWLQPLIFHLPVLFSFRTCLGMCSLGFLYNVFFQEKGRLSFFISCFLAQLSSGIVLIWITTTVLVPTVLRKQRPFFFLTLLTATLVSLFISIGSKFDFFATSISDSSTLSSDVNSPWSQSASVFQIAFSRNTFFDSLENTRMLRAAFFILLLGIVLTICTRTFFKKQYRQCIFFTVGTSAFLFEGLGPYALIIPVSLYLADELTVPIPDTPCFRKDVASV